MAVEYTIPQLDIIYPDSDGRPMAESDFQRGPLVYAVEALSIHFAPRPDVYVTGNIFLYYEQGNPSAVVSPDVFVVFGVPKRERPSYKLWEEGVPPSFVLEITSAATRAQDQGPKRGLYAWLGVQEYFQLDPPMDYLRPPLYGYTLVEDNYQLLPARTLDDGIVSVTSEVLGLELRFDPARRAFRFFDPRTGRPLLSHAEAAAAAQHEAAARREAEAALQSAQAELERLRAELARLKGPSGDP